MTKKKTSATSILAEKWRNHAYTRQQELRTEHPQSAALQQIEVLVREEVVQILGAYFRDQHRGTFKQRAEEEPAVLAREVGGHVGKTIAGILASNPEWPNEPGRELLHRRDVLVLLPVEIKQILHCAHWMNAAAYSRYEHERAERPGWEWDWLRMRLVSFGAFVAGGQHFTGKMVAPDLDYVLIRPDGSGSIGRINGTVEDFGPVEPAKHLPKPPTRTYQRSPNVQNWRTEITHQYIDGKWVEIADTEREEQ